MRLRIGLRLLLRQAFQTWHWPFTSREWANFNGEYTHEGLEAIVWVHSCWFSAEFVAFCDQQDLHALQYVEQLSDHWYAGGRCGLARRRIMR